MSKSAQMWIGAAIVVIIIIVGWVWYSNSSSPAVPAPSQTTTDTTASQAQATPADNSPVASSPSDTSDTAINQDTSAIDAQMNGLNTDSANVDSSVAAPAPSSSTN